MSFDIITQECQCYLTDKTCQLCRSDEFACGNDKCIQKRYICNGVDNCGDGSDEADCNKICKNDEILCVKDKTCLKPNLICDGKIDCGDESDEKDCFKVIPLCKKGTFECLNEKCIPNNQVCDGKSDCGDWSDEENCLGERFW
ncbi:Suppressor of tumorigenicity 14 protein [Thelohanellus kitauei]|uniref:Suppressor of tumorigenicity 14 protein n=1 Tax=Thelohanellus kitauei TaxID=669202 RepID=A0A0C2JAD5_THEKT|nr:Suppressor of tumorigenicity 14 protein [Thelohanellus kitauei]